MGDVVSLVEKAAETIEEAEAEKLAKKIQKGNFDLNDMAQQLKQLQKMGSLSSLMGMLPGLPQMQKKMKATKLDDNVVKRQLAIISSMTPKERARPELLKASRKRRVAGGSGSTVQEVNKLLKTIPGGRPSDEEDVENGQGRGSPAMAWAASCRPAAASPDEPGVLEYD